MPGKRCVRWDAGHQGRKGAVLSFHVASLPRVPCTRPERPALTPDEVSPPGRPPGPKEIRDPLRKVDTHMDGLPVEGVPCPRDLAGPQATRAGWRLLCAFSWGVRLGSPPTRETETSDLRGTHCGSGADRTCFQVSTWRGDIPAPRVIEEGTHPAGRLSPSPPPWPRAGSLPAECRACLASRRVPLPGRSAGPCSR